MSHTYSYSLDGERYHGDYKNRRRALDRGMDDRRDDYGDIPKGTVIYTGRNTYPRAHKLLPDRVADGWGEAVGIALDESAVDHAKYVPEGEPLYEFDEKAMEAYLVDCLRTYLKIIDPKANAATVEDVEEHRL